MNKMEYDRRLRGLIRDANAIRFEFRDGMYSEYLNAVKKISQLKKGKAMDSCAVCEPCEGKGKKKDSTGFYPLKCADCNGTGIKVLPFSEDQIMPTDHTTPFSRK